jgi:phosphatidylglycerophosphate synthase
MRRPLRAHAANALTALRVVLTPVFARLVYVGDTPRVGALAAAIFAVVAATDVWDGRIARRWDSASTVGRAFDHFADISFILVALGTYASLGLAPWWVPASIAASFLSYVVDSWSRSAVPGGLIGSRIGHAAGVLNYALIGVLVGNDTAGIHLVSDGTLRLLFWLVPVYSGLAVGARLATRGTGSALAPRRCAST